MHFNKPWRLTREKITHAAYAFVLPDPGRWTGSSLFFQSPAQQYPFVRHDFDMPAFSFAHDEVYGT